MNMGTRIERRLDYTPVFQSRDVLYSAWRLSQELFASLLTTPTAFSLHQAPEVRLAGVWRSQHAIYLRLGCQLLPLFDQSIMPHCQVSIPCRTLCFLQQLLWRHLCELGYAILRKEWTNGTKGLGLFVWMDKKENNLYQRLPTWTLSSANRSLISLPVAAAPLSMNWEERFLELRVRRMTKLRDPIFPFSSSSTYPESYPCFTKAFRSDERPSSCYIFLNVWWELHEGHDIPWVIHSIRYRSHKR